MWDGCAARDYTSAVCRAAVPYARICGNGAKMSGVYEWVRGMVCYLIIMTMILNLLPDKKYKKYLKLFTGVVFLLLVFGSFADLTGLEEQIAGTFERLTFQNDAALLKREIEDADGKRLERLTEGYKSVVEEDLKQMAEGNSLECISAEAVLDTDIENGTFGRVRQVTMQVRYEAASASSDPESRNAQRLAASREIAKLRTRIGEYYELGEGNIAVTLEN